MNGLAERVVLETIRLNELHEKWKVEIALNTLTEDQRSELAVRQAIVQALNEPGGLWLMTPDNGGES